MPITVIETDKITRFVVVKLKKLFIWQRVEYDRRAQQITGSY